MRAALRRLHSPDVFVLREYRPADPNCFGLFIQALVGPEGRAGEESFDFMLCTPEWLRKQVDLEGPQVLTWHLVVNEYDYDGVLAFIDGWCRRCEGATWAEVAAKVSQLGHWEFDRYMDHAG